MWVCLVASTEQQGWGEGDHRGILWGLSLGIYIRLDCYVNGYYLGAELQLAFALQVNTNIRLHSLRSNSWLTRVFLHSRT